MEPTQCARTPGGVDKMQQIRFRAGSKYSAGLRGRAGVEELCFKRAEQESQNRVLGWHNG